MSDFQPSGPPPPVPAPPPPAVPTSNGIAVASLVLGILAVVLFFTIWIPVVLGILAIVFGALGISKTNKQGAPQKGLAIAGLVCGAAGIALAILFIVFVIALGTSGAETFDTFGTPLPVS